MPAAMRVQKGFGPFANMQRGADIAMAALLNMGLQKAPLQFSSEMLLLRLDLMQG